MSSHAAAVQLAWLSDQALPMWGGHLDRGEPLSDPQMRQWIDEGLIMAVAEPRNGYVTTDKARQTIKDIARPRAPLIRRLEALAHVFTREAATGGGEIYFGRLECKEAADVILEAVTAIKITLTEEGKAVLAASSAT